MHTFDQLNVPATLDLRETQRIADNCDPLSYAKWKWLHDMQCPLGRLLAELYRVLLRLV